MPQSGMRNQLHALQIIHWPHVARELEISMTECQAFLLYFHDHPQIWATCDAWGSPHGTIVCWPELRKAVAGLHQGGEMMPVEIQYIWSHLEQVVDQSTCFLWLINPSKA